MTINSPSLEQVKPLTREGELRLNLGGRDTSIQGFKTVDLKEGSDLVADCSELPIDDASVKEIYASNILEHFPHPKTFSVLKEWRRVLEPKGKLWISVPDLDAMMRLIQAYGFTEFLRNLMYGDQLYDLAYHYTAFTYGTLANLCVQAGFSDVKRVAQLPYGVKDCSKNVDSFSGKSVMVNAEVTA